MLLLFEAISGLSGKFSKSVLIPIGEVPELQHMADFFGSVHLASSYLGLPLGANFKSKVV